MTDKKIDIAICLGSSCFSRGNKEILQRINQYIKLKNLEEKVNFHGKHCMAMCASGPILEIDGKIHEKVNAEDVSFLLSTYFE